MCLYSNDIILPDCCSLVPIDAPNVGPQGEANYSAPNVGTSNEGILLTTSVSTPNVGHLAISVWRIPCEAQIDLNFDVHTIIAPHTDAYFPALSGLYYHEIILLVQDGINLLPSRWGTFDGFELDFLFSSSTVQLFLKWINCMLQEGFNMFSLKCCA
jgi:hypothetical protein